MCKIVSNIFGQKCTQNTLFRFGVVGIANTLFDFLYFAILITVFSVSPLSSNIISYVVVVTQSYGLNKYWSFKKVTSGSASIKEYLLFIGASLGSLLISSLIIYFGEPFASIWTLKVSAAVIGPLVNYLLYKFIIFTPQKNTH